MNTRTRFTALLFVGLAVATIASTASADPPKTKLMITPGFAPGEPYGLPKFGFASSTIPGFGERIVDVRYGGRAYYLGLEPGDIILSLNGYKLTYTGSWNDALRNALFDGNTIRLKVRDVRTGNVYFRETYVDYNDGPVVYNYKVEKHNPHHDHDFHDDHHVNTVGGTLKTIKEVKKMFD